MSSGKTVCKEVCTNCKCTVVEKPLKQEKPAKQREESKKENCVATIVGVLSLPDNFCCGEKQGAQKENVKEKDDCNEVYRDLGECLQKCIVQNNKNGNNGNKGTNGTNGSNGNGKKPAKVTKNLDC